LSASGFSRLFDDARRYGHMGLRSAGAGKTTLVAAEQNICTFLRWYQMDPRDAVCRVLPLFELGHPV